VSTWFCQVARITSDLADQLSLIIFLLLSIFHLTWIDLAIKSISPIFTWRTSSDLIAISWHISFSAYSSLKKKLLHLIKWHNINEYNYRNLYANLLISTFPYRVLAFPECKDCFVAFNYARKKLKIMKI